MSLICGVIVRDKGEDEKGAVRFRTCGLRAPNILTVRNDQLFGICERHNRRLARAFPEMRK